MQYMEYQHSALELVLKDIGEPVGWEWIPGSLSADQVRVRCHIMGVFHVYSILALFCGGVRLKGA